MPSSPAPIGKRPDFKHSKSAAWSWPRLVPIHEQQSRLSQATQSSASPLRDHSEQEEPPATMASSVTSSAHAEEGAPRSPASSIASRSPTQGKSMAGSVHEAPNEHLRESLSSGADFDDEKRRAADGIAANSASNSVKNLAAEGTADSECEYVKDVAEKRSSGSDSGFAEDVAEKNDSPLKRHPLGDPADQGDIEIPVGYENTSMDPPITSDTQSLNVLIIQL